MDNKTIDTYDKMASEYDEETKDFWENFPTTFINEFISCLSKGGNILDVGSGPGRDGLILKEHGIRVNCVDASQAMVDMCTKKGLNATKGDFMCLPFEDGVFDGTWAYTSLLHIPKTETRDALKEIHRVLRSGGVLALGLIEGDKEGYKLSAGVTEPRWFSYFQKEEVESLLEQAGFENIYFDSFVPRNSRYLHFMGKKI